MTIPPGTPAVPAQQNARRRNAPRHALRRRLTELRGGPEVPPRPMDARALAALAANPGCRRRALLDGAGVDKGVLAEALGAPAAFGQSQFAFVRGNAFEARVKADGGDELIRLLCARTGERAPSEPGEVTVPDLAADGPAGRAARTGLALEEASAGRWALLDHPMLTLEVAGSAVYLEPDAVAVHPDGSWTVVEIKSFPILDGSADPAKVGAAARQAAVYALALECVRVPRTTADGPAGVSAVAVPQSATVAARREPVGAAAEQGSGGAAGHSGRTGGDAPPPWPGVPGAGPPAGSVAAVAETVVRTHALLICPKDFSNRPTAALIDLRKQVASTRRQLDRLTRLEEIAAAVPEDACFAPSRSAEQLAAAVESVPAAYSPECLASCELALHCRSAAREAGAVTALGRSVRGELGGLTTVDAVLAAADGTPDDDAGKAAAEPAAVALRHAARLRAEALAAADAEEAEPCR